MDDFHMIGLGAISGRFYQAGVEQGRLELSPSTMTAGYLRKS
jgi:hypothetical protein